MKIYLQQKNKAFTLIETLVAISIFTMSILGLMSILASGISNIDYAKKKTVATYLAQEGIEYIRNQRDGYVIVSGGSNGWIAFSNPTNINNIKTYLATPNPDPDFSDFNRSATIIVTGDDAKVTSTVTWHQSSGVQSSITFSEDLFNWVE